MSTFCDSGVIKDVIIIIITYRKPNYIVHHAKFQMLLIIIIHRMYIVENILPP